ncbi:disintegrin and metalloproteinase domain-containing protein 10-like [Diorhabda sublineata]|uniref:disintegrin and metalloproteinase domain-containing protein 10-like n=1 Tax=Diorhabda sublineata TaxID=1163346 RepID=UPI0024E16B71|nr:disintegrin and metalloproteinase domain-containing protein 10-like [Diorhabda sublineata]
MPPIQGSNGIAYKEKKGRSTDKSNVTSVYIERTSRRRHGYLDEEDQETLGFATPIESVEKHAETGAASRHFPSRWKQADIMMLRKPGKDPTCPQNYMPISLLPAMRKERVCSLLVTLDYSYINLIHQMNIDSAMQQVLLAIDEANSLFRSTDFDNDSYPDNVGFLIKYFAVFQTPDNRNLVPHYTKQAVDGRFYIKMFSRFSLINDVCLGIIFTGQSFKNDIVGISYTAAFLKGFRLPVGGICDKPDTNPYGLNLNTLAVSARNQYGRKVPQFIFDLSLCHELGHSFGSDHDSTKNCAGYIMAPHTPVDQNRKHYIFSSCSKRSILKTMSLKGYCFEDDDTPYCGNNIKESTEECDCGTVRDCRSFDVCCIPHGRPNACQIKRDEGYTCHPSQGLCCTSECHYANLQKFGVECKNFEITCPCANNRTKCTCGINGYCRGNICHSDECTRIGLEECPCPKTANTTSCRTCCFSKSSPHLPCSSANDITKVLIDSDYSVFKKLQSYVSKQLMNIKYGFFETYCQNNECVKLYFKNVSVGNFCTLFGKLGDCGNNGCEIHNQPPIYKTIQRRSIGTNKISSLDTILIVLFFIHLYSINISY